ncbi:hypothetical protein SAMN05518854_11286 [Variovorax sp. YR266]|nr:hypothetical protein SAMN05518854_11286 [Variovorax sp. YR266]
MKAFNAKVIGAGGVRLLSVLAVQATTVRRSACI